MKMYYMLHISLAVWYLLLYTSHDYAIVKFELIIECYFECIHVKGVCVCVQCFLHTVAVTFSVRPVEGPLLSDLSCSASLQGSGSVLCVCVPCSRWV